MKNILVTGGTGLVGSYLLQTLSLHNENNIFATKQKTSDINKTKKTFSYYNNNNFDKISWINLDIVNTYDVNNTLKNIDEVYHTAAFISYLNKDKDKMIKTNVYGTKNIVNSAIINNIKKFCYVSSIAAFGTEKNNKVITENTNWEKSKTSSAYSMSKFYAEEEVWRGIAEGLNAVIVNPSVILGAGNWNSGSSVIFNKIKKGLKYYTKGITGFVDVQDLTEIIILLMKENIFNENFIISSENLSYKELFDLIAKNLNVKAPDKYASKKLTEFVWRLEFIKSILTNQKPVITKQSAKTAHKKLIYSNKKITEKINFNFKPIKQSIEEISKIFINDFTPQQVIDE